MWHFQSQKTCVWGAEGLHGLSTLNLNIIPSAQTTAWVKYLLPCISYEAFSSIIPIAYPSSFTYRYRTWQCSRNTMNCTLLKTWLQCTCRVMVILGVHISFTLELRSEPNPKPRPGVSMNTNLLLQSVKWQPFIGCLKNPFAWSSFKLQNTVLGLIWENTGPTGKECVTKKLCQAQLPWTGDRQSWGRMTIKFILFKLNSMLRYGSGHFYKLDHTKILGFNNRLTVSVVTTAPKQWDSFKLQMTT